MFTEEVKTKDGVVKTIVARSQEELDEAVKIAKGESAPVSPDINEPKDGNKVGTTSPHTDPLVSDKFQANAVTQDGKPLPEEKPSAKVEEESPVKKTSKKK